MDCVPAEIRTQCLPNTSPESYRYANRDNSILFRISASVTNKQQYWILLKILNNAWHKVPLYVCVLNTMYLFSESDPITISSGNNILIRMRNKANKTVPQDDGIAEGSSRCTVERT
jgi:hypothetical protein